MSSRGELCDPRDLGARTRVRRPRSLGSHSSPRDDMVEGLPRDSISSARRGAIQRQPMAETQRDNRRWLVTAGVVVVLIVVAVFAFQSCRSDVSPAPPPASGSVGGPDVPPAAAPPATP